MGRTLAWCAAWVVSSIGGAAACNEAPTADADGAGSGGAGRPSAGRGTGGTAGSSVLAGDGGRLESNQGGAAGANGATSGAGAAGGAGHAAGAGGAGRAGSGAGPAGGEAGERADGGAGGEAGDSTVDSPAPCGAVTMLGHCVGDVYEWCDYFVSGIKQLDCGALGMRCEVEPDELGNDFPSAGCFGDACTDDDERCDGTLAYQCSPDGLTVHDCSKRYGPDTSCGPGQLGAGTCSAPYCDPDRRVYCDGSVAVICALDHNFYVEDCAEHDPAGTCTEIDPAQVACGGRTIQLI